MSTVSHTRQVCGGQRTSLRSSFCPPDRTEGSNSGCQLCCPVPLFAELSHQLLCFFFFLFFFFFLPSFLFSPFQGWNLRRNFQIRSTFAYLDVTTGSLSVSQHLIKIPKGWCAGWGRLTEAGGWGGVMTWFLDMCEVWVWWYDVRAGMWLLRPYKQRAGRHSEWPWESCIVA